MNKKQKRIASLLPLPYRMIQGGVGNDFVVKQYAYGAVMTRFPDMSHIIATELQKSCRNKFKEAIAYAKEVMKDKAAVALIKKRIEKPCRVFNAIVKEYMLRDKRRREEEKVMVEGILYRVMREKVEVGEVEVERKEPEKLLIADIAALRWVFLTKRRS